MTFHSNEVVTLLAELIYSKDEMSIHVLTISPPIFIRVILIKKYYPDNIVAKGA